MMNTKLSHEVLQAGIGRCGYLVTLGTGRLLEKFDFFGNRSLPVTGLDRASWNPMVYMIIYLLNKEIREFGEF